MNTTPNSPTSHARRCAILAAAVAAIVLLATGCAGNRYDRSTGESIDDRATTSRVKGALGEDTMFKYPDVKVTTFKGTVQLSGFANNATEMNRAAELARSVKGVKAVKNDIRLKTAG